MSPTVADGKLYIMEEKGPVFICGTGDEFQHLAKIEMGDAEDSSLSAPPRRSIASGSKRSPDPSTPLYS